MKRTTETRAVGRPRDGENLTAFGRFLDAHKISYDSAAQDLGLTRQYVNLLARGTQQGGPSSKLQRAIRDWAAKLGGRVPLESWE